MKKIPFLIFISIITYSCKAQIVPVENLYEYLEAEEGVPEGTTYIKDVNNLFDEFLGTWLLQNDNKNYTFIINKTTKTFSSGTLKDLLVIKYKIEDLDGTILYDTTLLPDDDLKNMQGRYFLEGGDTYLATFFGPNFNCGEYADIIMYIDGSSLSGNQLVFHLRPNPKIVAPSECNESWEWSFPKTTYLTFTKQ